MIALPHKLLKEQASIRLVALPDASHVRTPMGNWKSPLLELSSWDVRAREATASITAEIPSGVVLERFETLSQSGAALLEQMLMTLVPRDHDRAAAAHFARITGGVLLHIKGRLAEPVVIEHAGSADRYRNTLIILEPGSEAVILERHIGKGRASHVVEIFAKENAHVSYADVQELHGTLVIRKSALVERNASITWCEIGATRGTSVTRTLTRLAGEQANVSLHSLYLGDHEDVSDTGAEALHEAEHTQSRLFTKGALAGSARTTYEGILRIGAHAAKSSAFQEEHCLLLSEHADVKASPTLYIDNNDVQCSHAATAARPDAELLFYLQSRGLPVEEARRLLVKGFLWPVIETLPARFNGAIAPIAETIIDRFAGPSELAIAAGEDHA